MIAADELQSRMETAHLLRSPKNAEWLLSAPQR
jgi:antitoxin YefM